MAVVGFAIIAIAGRVVPVQGVERRLSVELDRVVVGVLVVAGAFKIPTLRHHVLWCGVVNGSRSRRGV